MIKNFFKVAFRSLWKQKGYSFLNIFGLAIGMSCSLLILLWIRDEEAVDNFHVKGDRLYSVYQRQYYDKKIESGHYTPGVLPDEMKKVLPEVEMSSGFDGGERMTFQVGDKILKEDGAFAGADFFRMFSYPLLEGKAESALSAPVSMAISRKMAVAFFGSPEAAMGKTIRNENRRDLKVMAVFEDLPSVTSEKFDYVINWYAYLDDNSWAKDWGNNGPRTLLLLRKDANAARFDQKITHFLAKYNKYMSKTFYIELGIQRFGDIYLHGQIVNGKIAGGRIEYVRLFSIVAIFILCIACINFMNLTTARSVKRAKEIGIRKVVGAVRPALIRQFLSEAVLLALISVIFAMGIVLATLPAFNQITGKEIVFPYASGSFWLSLFVLTLVTGMLSGSYPALFLSSFQPIRVLKGTLRFSPATAWFRKGLVVFQFMLSIVLIIGTMVVSGQVDYVQSVNLGYDRENLLYIPLEGDLTGKYKVFKDEAMQLPGVGAVSRASQSPTNIENGTFGVDWDGKDPNNTIMFTNTSAGYDFVKTMGLQVKEGRDYSPAYGTDTVGYILNEEAAKRIAYKDPIGHRLTFWGKKGTIIGVVRNFHFNSLHEPIRPLIIHYGEAEDWGSAIVRTKAGQTKETLKGLEALCRQLNPRFPFTYQFADEQYRNLYKSEQVVHGLANCGAALAIFISCLGLLGLAMFTAEQRTKEFGIRKVLGAKVGTLFTLLSKDFLLLVLVAFLLASPLAGWAMHKWLEGFEYRISLQWWVFALAGAMALLIALATVSFQAIKVAVANPVKSLRTE
ncbi:MAG TPA: ABC transporter permease [Puia sp.]|jgi:ABC-type antimicrobial peptide transport system permease subunit|nr:ABC transporter permease [Puia sp.]